jgi:hypothetical protein
MNHHQRPGPGEADTLTVRLSVPGDITYLAPRLRKTDLDSILAAGSPSAAKSLKDGLALSDICLTAIDECSAPVFMFGTVPYPRDHTVAQVWLMASDEIDSHRRALNRLAVRYLEVFHRKYRLLSNAVDCRNINHLRWLRWRGFHFVRTLTGYGPGKLSFTEITSIRKASCANLLQ